MKWHALTLFLLLGTIPSFGATTSPIPREAPSARRGMVATFNHIAARGGGNAIDTTAFVPAAAGPAGPLHPIPPELLHRRTALPDERNAAVEWLRATPLTVKAGEALQVTLHSYWNVTLPPPNGERLESVQRWLAANREALGLVEASLTKTQAQWPVRRPEEFESTLSAVRQWVQARLAQAGQLAEKRAYTEAAAHLLKTQRMATWVADGDGALIHYLVGVAAQTMVQQAIQKLALAEVPASVLEGLLKGLSATDHEPEVFCRAVKVEFQDYALKETDFRKLADEWQKTAATSPDALKFVAPEPMTRAFQVFLTPTLVAQHPHPFDRERQIRAAIPNYLRFLINGMSAWSDQVPEPDSEERIGQFLEDADAILSPVEDEPLPLNREAAERVRVAYNQFEDPMGRLFAALPSKLEAIPARMFRLRAEREATRLLIALRLFRLREQRWPNALPELVTKRYLDKLPPDPFGEGPFGFDRARLLIWSVGVDGEDDGGKDISQPRWAAEDAVGSLAHKGDR